MNRDLPSCEHTAVPVSGLTLGILTLIQHYIRKTADNILGSAFSSDSIMTKYPFNLHLLD